MNIRAAGIIKESIVDGPGIRMVIFTQGCKHNCPGCHNTHTHPFDGGSLVSIDSIIEQAKNNPLLDGLTLSGGEAFEQVAALSILAQKAKDMGLNIVTYTGYTFEYLISDKCAIPGSKDLLKLTDYLIDGRFDLNKKSSMLQFRGSSNQRIIDVKESLHTGSIKTVDRFE